MNRFIINRGPPNMDRSKAETLVGGFRAARFGSNKPIAVTQVGFYGPLANDDFEAEGPRSALIKIKLQEWSQAPYYGDVIPPVVYLPEVEVEVRMDAPEGGIIQCNLPRAVVIPRNKCIELLFEIQVRRFPYTFFYKLGDDHPVFARRTETESDTEFSFYSSSKHFASITFGTMHEVEGIGAINLEDGQVVFYDRECSKIWGFEN